MPIFEAPACRNSPPEAPFCLPASGHQVASGNLRLLSGFLTAMFPARRSFPAINTTTIFARHRLLKRATQKCHGRIPSCVLASTLDLVAAPAAFYRTCAFMLLLAPCALA